MMVNILCLDAIAMEMIASIALLGAYLHLFNNCTQI